MTTTVTICGIGCEVNEQWHLWVKHLAAKPPWHATLAERAAHERESDRLRDAYRRSCGLPT